MKIDIIGNKYGHLTIIEKTKNRYNRTAYIVQCDCGRISKAVHTKFNLSTGMVKTCNDPECDFAYQIKRHAQLNKNGITTHGLSHTKEYELWHIIKARCYEPTNISYPYYGGRGITMYEIWIDEFQYFYDYLQTLEETREQFEIRTQLSGRKVTLDRIDVDKNYEPGNIRWASQHEQVQNQRSNVLDENLVIQLRIAYYLNNISSIELHKQFQKIHNITVHYGTIWNAICGKTWNNIKTHKIINGQLVI